MLIIFERNISLSALNFFSDLVSWLLCFVIFILFEVCTTQMQLVGDVKLFASLELLIITRAATITSHWGIFIPYHKSSKHLWYMSCGNRYRCVELVLRTNCRALYVSFPYCFS
jgi:hypothetical protein